MEQTKQTKTFIKRMLACVMAVVILFSLVSCGGKQSNVKTVQHVKDAMDKSNRLTTGDYFLLEDGSILTIGDTSGTFAAEYAALPNLKKIIDSNSQMSLFALTEDGEIYYHDTKIMDGVIDGAYSTTNSSPTVIAVTENEIYDIYVNWWGVNTAIESPDDYTYVGSEAVCHYELKPGNFLDFSSKDNLNNAPAEGPFAAVSAELGDHFVLTTKGKVFANDDVYLGMSFFNWKNIAVFDAQREMLSSYYDDEEEMEITVAAILADGTVMAEGVYADEIRSWGKLSYITMSERVIVGLTPDGTLKVTGSAAEYIAPDIAGWQNIVAVKVGYSSTDILINAIDADGNCYQLINDLRWIDENEVCIVSPTGELIEGDKWCYKYSPDGTVYRSSGENGAWEHYQD